MEERAVASLDSSIKAINRLRRIFPPLERLLFKAFWFTFALIEIIRFLRSLL